MRADRDGPGTGPGGGGPPALAERLLAAVLTDRDWRESVVGDLHEEYVARREASPALARCWYWVQAVRLSGRFVPRAWRARATRSGRRREGSMGRWAGDLRFGTRSLLQRPGTSALLVSTLAVALSANAAIFAVFDALLVRPMSFPRLDRLVGLWESWPGRELYDRSNVAPANFLDWREQGRGVFADLVALEWWDANVRGRELPERVVGARVSPSFFDLLGVRLAAGRGLEKGDDTPGREHRVVLGYELWQRSYGGDAGLVGRTLTIDGVPYEVAGIAPPGFFFPEGAEAWAPLVLPADTASRESHRLTVYGLLEEGQSLDIARARAAVIARRLEKDHPRTNRSRGIVVETLPRAAEDPALRPIIAVWQAAAAFVLLIACVNVANLVLARAAERRRELAMRAALGAERRHLVQQLVAEGLVVAAAATLLSLPLTALAVRALRAGIPAEVARNIPGWSGIDVDGRLVAVTALLAAVAALLFSTAPALRSSGSGLVDALKEGGRGGSVGRSRQRGRNALVVAQVAAALMLLVGAGITVRGALEMLDGPQGFDPDRLLTLQVSLPESRYADAEKRRAFSRAVLERMAELPGVEEVAFADVLPGRGSGGSRSIQVEGDAETDPSNPRTVDARRVSTGYFRTLGIPILSGRDLDGRDDADGLPVALVSRSLAERYWPGQDPLGRRFRLGGGSGPWLTVVGVCGDVIHHWFERRNFPTAYRPYAQDPQADVAYALRTEGDPAVLIASARRAVMTVDPFQPAYDVEPMRRSLAKATIGLQYVAAVMAAFGGLALLLALTGVYGVMAYRVSLRTTEIGVRVALGATRADVLKVSLGQAARLTAAGLALGTVMAVLLGRALSAVLLGAVRVEPRTVAAFVLTLAAAALLAAYVPARRALAIDPVTALRDE